MMINEALGAASPVDDLNGDGAVNVVDVQIDVDGALGLGCSVASESQSAAKPLSATRALSTAKGDSRNSPSIGAGTNLAVAALPTIVTDLGTLGGSSTFAYGLNNLGQVVGSSNTGQMRDPATPVSHAFLWEAGHMTDLGLPAGSDAIDSAAYSINDAGHVAGVYSYPGHDGHDTAGFLYAGGIAIALSNVPQGKVSAINNIGQIVGDIPSGSPSAPAAFLWNAGRVIDLGTLGGTGSQARAINDSGQVAGSAYLDGNSAVHAFLYSGMGLADLGTLGGTNSMAFGIDSAGQVVGSSQAANNGPQHAFLYGGGLMMDLGTLGGTDSQADGINSRGLTAGWSRTASGERHAFLWSSGRMMDLNSLVTLEPGVSLEEATAVNDMGQIVANASNGRAYLIALPVRLQ